MEAKVRFGDLVRNSGRPEVVTLWTKPEQNPSLMKAIKQNRVLTVFQEPQKRPYGVLGFELRPGALFLLFPQRLPREQNARVIGINFQLIDQPQRTLEQKPRVRPVAVSAKRKKPLSKEPEPVITKPQKKQFEVKVRRTARLENDFKVVAKNKAAAKQEAMAEARQAPFELSQAKVQVDVVETK